LVDKTHINEVLDTSTVMDNDGRDHSQAKIRGHSIAS
jgi:hypothetical protein